MKKYLLTILFIGFICAVHSQDTNDLRKLVMKSHVILAGYSNLTTNYTNDFTVELSYTITHLDTMVVNTTDYKTHEKVKVAQPFDDYPVFWSDTHIIAADLEPAIEINKRYSNLLFLRKNGKQYESVGGIGHLEWDTLINYYLPAIQQLQTIEKIKDLHERYTKTIDWYIDHNDYPDNDFIHFYIQKGIIKDTLSLSEAQLQKSKRLFLQGNENLLPFIKGHFKTEINTYFLNRLRQICRLPHPNYSDYYDFSKIITKIYDFNYNDINYFLQHQLTSNVDEYDKLRIMNYLINMVEQDIEVKK